MLWKRNKTYWLAVSIDGVRIRESLKTQNEQEARAKALDRIAEIKQGRAARTSGSLGRMLLRDAVASYLELRKPPQVSQNTWFVDRDRAKPLVAAFGTRPLGKLTPWDISRYQSARLRSGASVQTVNMEFGLLRRLLKKARLWHYFSEDCRALPSAPVKFPRVLTPEEKSRLFTIASTETRWLTIWAAAQLAANTSARGIELKHLQWSDIDFSARTLTIRRSKTPAGHRIIPLNPIAVSALKTLYERASMRRTVSPDEYVFPSRYSLFRPARSWRKGWISITRAAGLRGLRFHDLRHQAITELAEAGVPEATIMSISGHLSRAMLARYSHIRLDARRAAVEKLER
jgi:integrase